MKRKITIFFYNGYHYNYISLMFSFPCFPFFFQQNGTAGAKATGSLTILTGKRNINDVQVITKWRGRK